MTQPKFQPGEQAIFRERSVWRGPPTLRDGQRVTVEYQCDRSQLPPDVSGVYYCADSAAFVPEQCLDKIPDQDSESTWGQVEKDTGWNPRKEVAFQALEARMRTAREALAYFAVPTRRTPDE